MAINQQPIQQSVALSVPEVSAGSGLDRLTQATTAVGNLVTDKLNKIAIDQAAQEGARDALDKTAPKDLLPNITAGTKAYNDAVANTEGRHMLATAEQQINEAYARHTDPSKFNSNTPALLKAELEGIKKGTLTNARPETQAFLAQGIDETTTRALQLTHGNAIKYDNAQMNTRFNTEIDDKAQASYNAYVTGDAKLAAQTELDTIAILDNYSVMSEEIKNSRPAKEKKLLEAKEVNQVVGGFAHSITEGTSTAYKANLANNSDNLPAHIWRRAVDEVSKLDKAHQNMLVDINGEELATVKNGINNGAVTTRAQIDTFKNLTLEQRITQTTALETKLLTASNDAQKLIDARRDIVSGRSSFVPVETKDKMLKSVVKQIDESKQQEAAMNKTPAQPADIFDISNSILGRGEHPMSGMSGLAMGTDIPKFNSQLSTMLTKGTPQEVAQAGMVYQSMTEVDNGYKNVNITAEALTVAKEFSSLIRGTTDPLNAGQLAIDATRDTTNAQREERNKYFQSHYNAQNSGTKTTQIDRLYRNFAGRYPAVEQNKNAIGVFRDTFYAHWMRSGNEETALEATKDHMRNWGTSTYYAPNVFDDGAPEKEFEVLTSAGHSFDNQLVVNLQKLINGNENARKLVPGIPEIKWADPKQTMPESITEDDKLYKKLTLGNRPRVVIDGHESDVYLTQTAMSNLGKKNYSYAYFDKFGSFTPITDVTNTRNGLSTFAPVSLAQWIPQLTIEQKETRLQTEAEKNYYAQKDKENYMPRILRPIQALGQAVEESLTGTSDDSFERLTKKIKTEEDKDKRIKEIKLSINKDENAQALAGSTADNVAISADTGAVIPGNIDMNTRPQVQNKDGTISTVRSIGINFNDLEYVIPTVSDDGEILSDKDAVALFKKTKKHLGAFKTVAQANKFAEDLHESEAKKLKDSK